MVRRSTCVGEHYLQSAPSTAAGPTRKQPAPSSTPSIGRDEWDGRLADVQCNAHDINRLVMNYLIVEGYKDAAEKFSLETGIAPSVMLSSIKDRMAIRQSVHAGRISEAAQLVNDLDPEILDTNPKLCFHLQQQAFIELIRAGNIADALAFAQDELAPRGEENPEFLEELEQTMALLAFDDVSKSPVAHLADISHRQKIASELNAAILSAQCQDKDPKLPSLLKLLTWAQHALNEKVNYPRIKNFATGEFEYPDTEMSL